MFDVSFEILDNLAAVKPRYALLRVEEDDGYKTVKSFKSSYEATKEACVTIAHLAEDSERVNACVNGEECVLKCSEDDEPEKCPFEHSFPVIITVVLDCYKMVWKVTE